jgi:hypothetical protein
VIDDGCSCPGPGSKQACFAGDPVQAGKGVCTYGVQECIDTGKESFTWGPCQNSGSPGQETCNNGTDDDCDGSIDEKCGCQADVPCQTGCGPGVQPCVGGVLGACNAPQPLVEVCNGKDDNCNGLVDENVVQGCASECGPGESVCLGGSFGPCQPLNSCATSCGNKSCDGSSGETCQNCPQDCGACPVVCGDGVCQAGETCQSCPQDCKAPLAGQACSTGLPGVCNQGLVNTCGACVGVNQPAAEVCGDGLDNNCNNLVDDGCGPVCGNGSCEAGESCQTCQDCKVPGAGQPCSTGQPGVCSPGKLDGCGVCVASLTPGVEVCGDGLDNNCNGQTDENCVGVVCPDGTCGPGETCGNCPADCKVPGAGQPCATGQPGVCSQGTNNACGQCVGPQPAAVEVCGDGLDNNCNGQTDEGCAPVCSLANPCNNFTLLRTQIYTNCSIYEWCGPTSCEDNGDGTITITQTDEAQDWLCGCGCPASVAKGSSCQTSYQVECPP